MRDRQYFLVGALTVTASLLFSVLPVTSAQTRSGQPRPVKSTLPMSAPAEVPEHAAAQAMGCLIEPHSRAEVAASTSGVITAIRVERGDRVKRGQIIAVLDNRVEKAVVNAAKARASILAEVSAAKAIRDMAKQKAKRIAALNRLSYGAKLELELAQGELSVSRHRLQQARDNKRVALQEHHVAQRQLEQRYVRSPINGIVADRMLNPGERADGRPIVRLMRLDRLKVEVIIPSQRFGEITEGMTGKILPDVPNSEPILAQISQVDRFIDAASGTFRARLTLANDNMSIPAGVRCEVTFESTEDSTETNAEPKNS